MLMHPLKCTLRRDEAQNLFDKLCAQHNNMESLPIIVDSSQIRDHRVGGRFDCENKIVLISEDIADKYIEEIVYHEFRHYWQSVYYSEVFNWWVYKSRGLYKKYYETIFCTIEEDARIFGETKGRENRMKLLEFYSEDELNSFVLNPSIINLAIEQLTQFVSEQYYRMLKNQDYHHI